MKRTGWNCFWAYTPLSFKIGTAIGMLIVSLLGFLLYSLMGAASAFLVSPIVVFVIGFVDYMAFSGINAKKQRVMEMLRSSYWGPDIVRKTMGTDIAFKGLMIFLGYMGCFAAGIQTESTVMPACISMIITAFSSGMLMIWTRRMGVTISMQMLSIYLGIMLTEGLSVIWMSLSMIVGEGKYTVIFNVLLLILMTDLAALSGVLLYKDSVKSFMNGYSDNTL